MIHFMIDIETLGTKPGSVIASIGAVAFDAKEILHVFDVTIDMEDAQQHGLTIDAATVKWWLQQSESARGALTVNCWALEPALNGLSNFIDCERRRAGVMDPNSIRIWAKPVMFDIPLLEAAYRATGIDIPWHYREPRYLRTLLEAAGINDK